MLILDLHDFNPRWQLLNLSDCGILKHNLLKIKVGFRYFYADFCICGLFIFSFPGIWSPDFTEKEMQRCWQCSDLNGVSWFHMFTPAAWLKCVESVAFVAFKARLRILTILLSGALATFVACIGVCPAEAGVGESTLEDTCQVFRWQDFCILDFNLQTFDVARTSDSDPACVCHIH